MAICPDCDQEMSASKGGVAICTVDTITFPDGEERVRAPYMDERGFRCHDCNVRAGGLHHPGCDMERCPKCSGQLISCGCLDETED